MTTEEQATRRPGRPKREEKTNQERRRRKGGSQAPKLAIPESVKQKYPDMEFRWGRDDEGRIQQLTQNDDWDVVPDTEPMHAGVTKAGAAMKSHLLMKPKAFMADDNAEKLRLIDAKEQGTLARPTLKQAEEQGAEFYSVPGNKLS